MRQFKKRTLALVLASVITVAGSFATERYKNTLKALNFEKRDNGVINMVVETSTAYAGNVTPIKRGANKYVLMLPEVDANAVRTNFQNVPDSVLSVETNTLPYTNNSNGYAKITVTTNPSINLVGENRVYIPSATETKSITDNASNNSPTYQEYNKQEYENHYEHEEESQVTDQEKIHNNFYNETIDESVSADVSLDSELTSEEEEEDLYQTEKDPYETYLLLLSVLLIIFVCIYIFKRSTSKMREIAGEKIDIDEEPKESKIKKENKKTKLNKIKNTIKTLDATYAKTRNGFANSEYTATAPVQMEEIPEIANVVDLDEIFQETKNKTTEISPKEYEENLALEEFLRGFSFIEDEPEEPIEESVGYDEEFYNKVMSNNRLKFTDVDIECINKLLNTEINDLTLKNIKNYAVSNPIKKVPTKEQILEDLVTTYTISQNISFSKDDIGALYKLISVEIDHDFITDLKTNPERTKEMYRELQSQPEKTKKTSEIITLNVKDFLPDLSEELRKQGNRQIEPEIKPITVFYSEGYEVSKLAINDVLPDLSAELHKKDAYVSKPSAEYQIVDNSYEVEKMHIDYDLPDLEDVVANPQKYAEPEPEEIYVDEDALLNNISNVRFKPFYDGSESFEILNDLEEVNLIKQRELEELKASFLDLDAIKKDISIPESITNKTESIENKEEIIKPKTIIEPNIIESEIKDKNPETINQTKPTSLLTQKNEKSINKELQKKIEQRREERIRQRSILAFSDKRPATKEQVVNKQDIKCILEGKTYSVTSSVDFGNNMGCHLAKSEEGYSVLGYIGDNLIRLKNYTNLKSEKIQARVSEKLENGLLRYIVRIGLNKFILDVSPEKIQYVMDLC